MLVDLRNEARLADNWLLDVLYSNLQYVDLYAPLPGGDGFVTKMAGSLRSPALRDFRYPRAIFSLHIPLQSQETVYMRFQSGTSMTLNLKLWSQQAFINRSLLEQIMFGIFFGILVGLLFYNLAVYLSIREATYLFCVFLLSSLLLHEASYNGYLETYVIPGLFSLKRAYHPILFALMVMSMR